MLSMTRDEYEKRRNRRALPTDQLQALLDAAKARPLAQTLSFTRGRGRGSIEYLDIQGATRLAPCARGRGGRRPVRSVRCRQQELSGPLRAGGQGPMDRLFHLPWSFPYRFFRGRCDRVRGRRPAVSETGGPPF